MIAAQPTDTRINLGEDGQLPKLVLEEEEQGDTKDDGGEKSNPLLLTLALCASIGMSAVMFLIPEEAGPVSEAQGKATAREDIERYYTGRRGLEGETLIVEPYQRLLREALQAHNQGEYSAEKRQYRAVLRLLRAENHTNRGLTGQVLADMPPNDKHLEDRLATLLKD